MVQRYDDLTPEQLAQREQRLVSYESAQQTLADPERMAWLRERIAEADARLPAPEPTPEQQPEHDRRVRSHETGLRRLADPAFVARLDAQIAALDAAPPAPRLQPGEFLERVTRRLADGPAGHLSL